MRGAVRINIENAFRQTISPRDRMARFHAEQLIEHLKELRDRYRAGDTAVVDEFFKLYVFDDTERARRTATEGEAR